MVFDPVLAEIRFGMGLSPTIPAPSSVTAMLGALAGPDKMARRFPIPTFSELLPGIRDFQKLQVAARKAPSNKVQNELRQQGRELRLAQNAGLRKSLTASFARSIAGSDALRERMTHFWADHFTVVGKAALVRYAVPSFVEEAIRPNINGHFKDVLKAAVTHPMMLLYLDQEVSAGPNSTIAKRGKGGLNENLAREVLELHTLGVGGGYTQRDVRQLAELMTGLSARLAKGFVFRPGMAEPGAEQVLGRSYGGGEASISDIHAVLDDLAAHPDTARHLARKLAVHFVSDIPDPQLVESLVVAYTQSDGHLPTVYAALLNHRASWAPKLTKARQPFDFLASALRALDVKPKLVQNLTDKQARLGLAQPMQKMGQNWTGPDGPDGWPEDAAHWITPQAMAARIDWAMRMPSEALPELPDPREFVKTALGGRASQQLVFAAGAAETRAAGVGIILAAPEFQRR